jgi:Flp pilus assembly protein TadD
MRTEDQIKRKLHELNARRQALRAELEAAAESAREAAPGGAADGSANSGLAARLERLEEQIVLLEWVLNEPSGKYHV